MFYQTTLGRAERLFPDGLAVIAGEQRLTFAELSQRVRRLRAGLHEQGFRPGDRLAMLLPNCLEFLELVYACTALGVLVVPINTRLAAAEIEQILRDCQPRGVITHPALPAPEYAAPLRLRLGADSLPCSDGEPPAPRYSPDDILGLFYTSGTTGQPKGVQLSHRNHLVNILHLLPHWQMDASDRFLHVAPMFHLADFPMLGLCPNLGAAQVILPRFDPEQLFKAVERERATHTIMIPTMVNLMTQHPALERHDLSSLRLLVYGGSPMMPDVIARTRAKLPHTALMQAYGMTESCCVLTLLLDEEHDARRLLSCGRPVAGVELEVVDERGAPVQRGQRGVIQVRAENVMVGYWNQPEETARALRRGWLHTGDIAYEDEAGFLYIVDREKDMIITGGENVYPTEVEVVLCSHAAVSEAAVIGVPDATWGEIVTACIHVRAGAAVDADELRDLCRSRLAGYKVPKRFEFLPSELPKGGTGKILKRALRTRYWADSERQVS